MKVGLVGFGSIGKRHARNLLASGCTDITLFRRVGRGNELGLRESSSFDEMMKGDYDFVVVSNPTACHFEVLSMLLPRNINVIVEKPIAYKEGEAAEIARLLKSYSGVGMVAYNTRFHPCVLMAKDLVDAGETGRVLSSRFYIGQYLPDWHPESDYRRSGSALKSKGGGVTLDLVHEVDLACCFLGEPDGGIMSLTGRISDLEIETEDCTEILYRSRTGAFVSIHMDYLCRGYRRCFELMGERGTLYCDLFENRVKLIGDRNAVLIEKEFPEFERNDMYMSMMGYYMESIASKKSAVPSLYDGLSSLSIALDARRSLDP